MSIYQQNLLPILQLQLLSSPATAFGRSFPRINEELKPAYSPATAFKYNFKQKKFYVKKLKKSQMAFIFLDKLKLFFLRLYNLIEYQTLGAENNLLILTNLH